MECVCGVGSFIKCRDALNCFGSYRITASVCVRSVLSATMCGNIIISGKLSHVHLVTYVLGLTGTCSVYGIETFRTVRLDVSFVHR
jgi:predicted exporter